jgi:hypothetical protein
LRGNRRNCESDWCGEAARKNGDIVIDDQFLSYPFRLVRYRGIVTDDQLDPLASDVRAVLLNKQLRSCNHFIAFYGERTGHWNQEAHLDRCLRLRRHFPGAYKSTGGSERFQKNPSGFAWPYSFRFKGAGVPRKPPAPVASLVLPFERRAGGVPLPMNPMSGIVTFAPSISLQTCPTGPCISGLGSGHA